MVDVDSLNEDIKKFGKVIEKVEELPKIYELVQEQLSQEKQNTEELKKINDDAKAFSKETIEKISEIDSNVKLSIEKVENDLLNQIIQTETNIKEYAENIKRHLENQITIFEKNTQISLMEIKDSLEEVKTIQRFENSKMKRRFIVVAIILSITFILGIINIFI